ncbi:MAG: TatD family hydrolase [Bacteroidota bacterium]
MSAYWVDTHAHLYAEEFNADRDDVMARCEGQNVRKIFMPNVDHATIDGMMEAEQRYPGRCFAMMGLHPCSVKKDFERELYVVEEWLSKRKFSAIGEIGTDLYWDKTFWAQQKEAFAIQVKLARQHRLPIVIHCRETLDETIAMVGEMQDENLTGIFHCFTGSAEQAQKIIDLNFYLGIGGVATFKKGGMETVLPDVPTDRIVFETDSPYLTPTPHRGKRNEPSYIPLIAQKTAEIKKISVEELRRESMNNALKIFQQNP